MYPYSFWPPASTTGAPGPGWHPAGLTGLNLAPPGGTLAALWSIPALLFPVCRESVSSGVDRMRPFPVQPYHLAASAHAAPQQVRSHAVCVPLPCCAQLILADGFCPSDPIRCHFKQRCSCSCRTGRASFWHPLLGVCGLRPALFLHSLPAAWVLLCTTAARSRKTPRGGLQKRCL